MTKAPAGVVMTTVGSIGALAVVTTPGLSHVFGCTSVGPLASGPAVSCGGSRAGQSAG